MLGLQQGKKENRVEAKAGFPCPWWLSSGRSACSAGDEGSIPDREDPLEKEMATHFSVLAWKIPWPEEPGGLQSQSN